MSYSLLQTIQSPDDLKKLPEAQLPELCGQIREFLIEKVSKSGGHLASNLGAVELTVAIHRAFHLPEDKLVFDVGHQCYTHKVLTGRQNGFDTLRGLNGLSGFPSPAESEYDAFVAGHGNTSLSAAIGMARANKLKKKPGKVVVFIGDGAYTGGMVYEGMNNIEGLDNLIVVLNDNKMSIGKNVGQMARHLTALRTDPRYTAAKDNIEHGLDLLPVVGNPVIRAIKGGKQLLRRRIYRSTLFEELGFQYVGPVDGHDVIALSSLLANLKGLKGPILLHAVTTKGKGFAPAEANPGEFHGVSAFDVNNIDPDAAPAQSFSTEFGRALAELGKKDERICAITAAMKYGTGLQFFYHAFPKRFFDVGMAEQHAVTFAAGLSCSGMLPVVAIYSSFFQRAYDQMLHDLHLMNSRVLLACDRAGLVPGDGATHQGVYDVGMFRSAGFRIVSPANYAELRYWLEELLLNEKGPAVIRYPRGAQPQSLAQLPCTEKLFDVFGNPQDKPAELTMVCYGTQTAEVLEAQQLLEKQGKRVDVIKLNQIAPLPDGVLEKLLGAKAVLVAEESIRPGSVGRQLAAILCEAGWQGHFAHCAVDPDKLTHASVPQLKALMGLDAFGMVSMIEKMLSK